MSETMLSERKPGAQAVLHDEEDVAQWLLRYISEVLAVPVEKISLDASFQQLGLDSSAAVGMTGDLSEWLRCEIDPAAAYDHPNIRALAKAVLNPAQG